jgi:hypothetical protein
MVLKFNKETLTFETSSQTSKASGQEEEPPPLPQSSKKATESDIGLDESKEEINGKKSSLHN